MSDTTEPAGQTRDQDRKQPDSEGAPAGRPTGSGQWIERACPVCGKKFHVERSQVLDRSKTFYPFCSQRCRLVDLGRWLNADYRFSSPVETLPEEPEDEGPVE